MGKDHHVRIACAAIEREANMINGFAKPKLCLRACSLSNKRGVKLSAYPEKKSNSIECAEARHSKCSKALFIECLASLADVKYQGTEKLKVHEAMRAAIAQAVKQYKREA